MLICRHNSSMFLLCHSNKSRMLPFFCVQNLSIFQFCGGKWCSFFCCSALSYYENIIFFIILCSHFPPIAIDMSKTHAFIKRMRLARSKALPAEKDKKIIARNIICSQTFNQDELKHYCSNCESNADVLSIKKHTRN